MNREAATSLLQIIGTAVALGGIWLHLVTTEPWAIPAAAILGYLGGVMVGGARMIGGIISK